MEKTIVFYTQLIISILFFIYFFNTLINHTRRSRKACVSQILFFVTLHSIISTFTINNNNVVELQKYAFYLTLCAELIFSFIYNYIFISTSSITSFPELWKARKFYTFLPFLIPLTIFFFSLLFGREAFISTPEVIPKYSISGYENLFLRRGFILYHQIFSLSMFISVSGTAIYQTKNERFNRSTYVLIGICIIFVFMGFIGSISGAISYSPEYDNLNSTLIRVFLGFISITTFHIFFTIDGREVLVTALKRNFFDSFVVPLFIFTKDMDFAFTNTFGEKFIKRYNINSEPGTKMTEFFSSNQFKYIALPKENGDVEIHYIISLLDDVTYTLTRTPLYTRFGNICGYSVTVTEFENSFLVSSLEESSYTDSLTLCKTRRIFENSKAELMLSNKELQICTVKMKNLEKINNELGHDAGDEYLKTTVYILSGSQSSNVYRLESSTFTFFLLHEDKNNADKIIRHIQKACEDFSRMRPLPLELDISLETILS